MLSSKKLKILQPYIDIVESHKGKTLGEVFAELGSHKHEHFKKGASGLIIENLLGLRNNNSKKADIEESKIEIKVLPVKLNNLKAKEPTQIKMINYVKVAREKWEDAEIRDKIETIFWIAYGVNQINGKFVSQDKYVILDWFIDVPDNESQKIFKKDWEEIRTYIIDGRAEQLSCSMGVYIEPKTKGKNKQDFTDAPDGKGGLIKAVRRAFYFKRNYTNSKVITELDIECKK
ncbi:MAG: MutH/Sau3AI family endonuclease [Parcubacteria group bacterium]